MKTYLYRASNLKYTITFLAVVSCDLQYLSTSSDGFSRSELKQTLEHLNHLLPIFLRFVLL